MQLPKISAQELMAKMAESDAQKFSGMVQFTGFGGQALHGGGKGVGAAASPQSESKTETRQVAADGPEKQRVPIGGKTLIHNGTDAWEYDSGSNIAVHHTVPRDAPHDEGDPSFEELLRMSTPQGMTEQTLKAAGDASSATVGGTTKVAGRDAYQLVIKPKDGYTDSIRVAVDAANGVPLKLTVTSKRGGPAPMSVGYTRVDFTKPAASTFAPPKGAKIVEGDQKPAKTGRERGQGR
ncbi:sigma-E factor regulatory protein RseB domain-containing protein [Streptomyces coeruleorubidus]|uniref:sigma-E factor regulatory protein RseB domain-containing protein n=1 Tax=Streptomyces coeruleorubidus TaxID=116188 RepID=UPI0036F798F8